MFCRLRFPVRNISVLCNVNYSLQKKQNVLNLKNNNSLHKDFLSISYPRLGECNIYRPQNEFKLDLCLN